MTLIKLFYAIICFVMYELYKPDNNLFLPQNDDFLEVARYLGYKKTDVIDNNTLELIKECSNKMFSVINPNAVYECFDVNLESENLITFAEEKIISKDLSINLTECKKVILLASTIGSGVDSFIKKMQHVDSVKAAICNACGAMYIEKLVDLLNENIKENACTLGMTIKPRFSPGYGDVSLKVQKIFFKLLPCSKIGLSLMDTFIMSPEKSVTAFIGLK